MIIKHPNILDNLAFKIYPRYLYPGQECETVTEINVGIIHKLPDSKPFWKIMDYVYIKKGAVMNFLGLAGSLHIEGDILPRNSVMEIISAVSDDKKSPGKQLSRGDLVCLTPYDRQFITAKIKA